MLDNDAFVNVLYMCLSLTISPKPSKKTIIVFIFFGRVNSYSFTLAMSFKATGIIDLSQAGLEGGNGILFSHVSGHKFIHWAVCHLV